MSCSQPSWIADEPSTTPPRTTTSLRSRARALAHCTNASRSFSSLLQSVLLQSQLGRFLSSPVSLSSTFVFPFITCPLFLFSLSPFSPVSCVNSTRLHIRVFFRPFFQFLFFLFSLGLSDFCRCHSSSLHVSVPVTAVVQISPEF